jgi:glycosyltransferase involved in cell wall biosynthesis
MSIYLISVERGLDKHSRLTLNLLRKIESKALKLPDRLIQDTAEYIAWFEKTYGLSKECFRLVPTGADDRIFRPLPPKKCDDGILRVIYYGTFIANHGVEYIIEAAHYLAHEENIHFELIGNGPEKEKASELTEKYNLRNLTFIDWLDQSELVKRVAQADLCLGAFGNTPQSVMTVQNKIFEGLAMAKPVITGDSPAVRQFLEHRVHVYLCERANGKSLANAIQTIRDDLALRDRIARNGHIIFTKRYDLSHIGQRYASHLESLISDFR